MRHIMQSCILYYVVGLHYIMLLVHMVRYIDSGSLLLQGWCWWVKEIIWLDYMIST